MQKVWLFWVEEGLEPKLDWTGVDHEPSVPKDIFFLAA